MAQLFPLAHPQPWLGLPVAWPTSGLCSRPPTLLWRLWLHCLPGLSPKPCGCSWHGCSPSELGLFRLSFPSHIAALVAQLQQPSLPCGLCIPQPHGHSCQSPVAQPLLWLSRSCGPATPFSPALSHSSGLGSPWLGLPCGWAPLGIPICPLALPVSIAPSPCPCPMVSCCGPASMAFPLWLCTLAAPSCPSPVALLHVPVLWPSPVA